MFPKALETALTSHPLATANALSPKRYQRMASGNCAGHQRIGNLIRSGPISVCRDRFRMMFVMAREIAGQANSKVLCRSEIIRTAGTSGKYVSAGYSFLPDD